MKFLPLVVVAVVGMVARVSAADSPQGMTREVVKKGVTTWDKNSDGYLDKDEIPGIEDVTAMLTLGDNPLWSRDANKDGKLSIDEYVNFTMKQNTGGQGGQGGPSPGGPSNPDLNSDGFITKDEATALLFQWNLNSALDPDRFSIHRSETGVTAIAPPNTVTDDCWNAMVKRADTNNDKKINKQEFIAASSSGEMPEACSLGGASSMKAAFSLLSVFALALRLF